MLVVIRERAHHSHPLWSNAILSLICNRKSVHAFNTLSVLVFILLSLSYNRRLEITPPGLLVDLVVYWLRQPVKLSNSFPPLPVSASSTHPTLVPRGLSGVRRVVGSSRVKPRSGYLDSAHLQAGLVTTAISFFPRDGVHIHAVPPSFAEEIRASNFPTIMIDKYMYEEIFRSAHCDTSFYLTRGKLWESYLLFVLIMNYAALGSVARFIRDYF